MVTLHKSLEPRLTKYIPHLPHPKQQAFLLLSHLGVMEALYGGSSGGGKTAALLMAALQYADVPGYAALLLRRTFPDLSQPGALIPMAKEWLSGTDAYWSEQRKTWYFPSKASLTFGYLEHDDDVFQYQGSSFQFCGFDELTQHTEYRYRYMFSRLRRKEGMDVPLRMRSASNPGGRGHDWVKRRFIDEGAAAGRAFIRAKLEDNPSLDKESYLKSLAELDPITRAQYLNGDWSARASGALFKREWFRLVDAAPANCRWVRFWDLAATETKGTNDPDWTAGVKLGLSQGRWYVTDVRRVRTTPQGVEALVKQTAELDGKSTWIRIEQEPGSSGVNTIDHYQRHVLPGWNVQGVRATGSKVERAGPVSSAAEAGNVLLVRGAWVTAFLDEFEGFPQGEHDDQCFPAGTPVTTMRGDIPIEDIRSGDYVLTRQGWNRVAWAGQTGFAQFLTLIDTDSGILEATDAHPVWVEQQGFVPVSAIREGSCLVTLSNSRDVHIGAIRGPNSEVTEFISNVTSDGSHRPDICIGTSGNIIMGQFQKGRSFITEMVTPSTTVLKTLPACLLPNIPDSIDQKPGLRGQHKHIFRPSDPLHLHGIDQYRDANGIENTGEGRWNPGRLLNGPVAIAEQPLRLKSLLPSIVRSVAMIKLVHPIPVYNLTVEGEHEFFANGFLVHNCDAASGAMSVLARTGGGVGIYV